MVVKYGINHITQLVESGKAQAVVIAHDVDPIELVVWLPALCKKMGVPYCIVKVRVLLGLHARVFGPLRLSTWGRAAPDGVRRVWSRSWLGVRPAGQPYRMDGLRAAALAQLPSGCPLPGWSPDPDCARPGPLCAPPAGQGAAGHRGAQEDCHRAGADDCEERGPARVCQAGGVVQGAPPLTSAPVC